MTEEIRRLMLAECEAIDRHNDALRDENKRLRKTAKGLLDASRLMGVLGATEITIAEEALEAALSAGESVTP